MDSLLASTTDGAGASRHHRAQQGLPRNVAIVLVLDSGSRSVVELEQNASGAESQQSRTRTAWPRAHRRTPSHCARRPARWPLHQRLTARLSHRDTREAVYHRRMGSSGMKRRGRRHLPKVGTRLANEHELHDRRERALHPVTEDPWRRRNAGSAIVAAIVAAVVVIGVVALVFAT
jgi:hypothetical protein